MLKASGAIVKVGSCAIPEMKIDAVVFSGAVDGIGAILIADIEETPESEDVEAAGRGLIQKGVDHKLGHVHGIVVVGPSDAERAATMEEFTTAAMNKVAPLCIHFVLNLELLRCGCASMESEQEYSRNEIERRTRAHVRESFLCRRTIREFAAGRIEPLGRPDNRFNGRSGGEPNYASRRSSGDQSCLPLQPNLGNISVANHRSKLLRCQRASVCHGCKPHLRGTAVRDCYFVLRRLIKMSRMRSVLSAPKGTFRGTGCLLREHS